ncbi:MAG: hypothetical protein HY912_03525 [Desulfomonile tiedjei]|uniref:Uncharacterized protein n=1 Tax=Desulfomonile tiedjei TaxID=2358 RepID=A0A9D6V0P9_9BACT|nr:hypothetical protein [Desulfomonile tiedjei]
MKSRTARVAMIVVVCLMAWAGISSASAKVPDGYKDIKLGMSKTQVLDLLQKTPSHFSFEDMGDEIGEIVRSDDLFRYATYRFNKEGELVEISLEMREIIGREKCLEAFNSQHGLQLTPVCKIGDANFCVEVRDNNLIMKKNPEKDTHAAAK